MRASSRIERLTAKHARCADPYWRAWLETAIRFAIWQETGARSLWRPEPPPSGDQPPEPRRAVG